jgi:hypothetical protein
MMTTSSIPSVQIIAGANPAYIQTVAGRFHRFVYDNSDWVKLAIKVTGVALIPLLLYTHTFILTLKLLTITAAIISSSGVGYGAYNGYNPGTIIGHFKTILSSPFDLFIPAKHLMTTHVFKERDSHDCSLRYVNDVPVLSLKGTSAQMGYAQGLLLGDRIEMLLTRWMAILWPFVPNESKAEALCAHWESMLSDDIKNELHGIVSGFNLRMREKNRHTRITFNQLLLLHLVPDIEHTSAASLARNFAPTVGCTVVLRREHDGVKMARLMDWVSLNAAGSGSLLIERELEDGTITQEVGIPGLVGVVTGKSSRGLAVAMNVALGETKDPKGLPAIFINRIILNESADVEDAIAKAEKLSAIGPYHLSLADDKKNGATVHFHQGDEKGKSFVRRLGDEPLIVTNSNITAQGETRPYFNSTERRRNLERFIAENSNAPLEDALKVPLVNNQETVHYVVMEPSKQEIRCAFAEAYAADAELRTVSVKR